MITLINVVAFQIGWFACVIGASRGHFLAGPIAAAGVIALHLFLAGRRAGSEALVILLVTLAGSAADSLLMRMGVLEFAGGAHGAVLCPVWMMALWAMFATLLTTSLSWMRGRYLLGAILGAVGGPLSYFGGQRLGSLALHPSLAWSIAAIAAEWAVAMPATLWLSARVAMPEGMKDRRIVEAPQP